MPGYRTVVRDVRGRVFATPVQETIDGTASEVERRLQGEFREIRRILGDQGDAADEVAEVLGRTITRLSTEVAELTAEVVRLRERLDRLDRLDTSG